MKTVYFVRHAQPNLENHVDLERELTVKGLEDRRLVTAFFQSRPVDGVYSSPYRRAMDTIEPFAASAGLPIQVVDDFRERKVGEGWIEDFHEYSLRQWADFSYKLPGGECIREVQERNIEALRGILRPLRAGGTLVVGSHGTALSTIINYYQPDFGCEEFYRLGKMPWIVEFRFEDGFKGEACREIVSHDLFTGEKERLLQRNGGGAEFQKAAEQTKIF